MKKIFFSLIMLLSVPGFAQSHQSDYDISTDKKTGDVIYKGQCSFEDLNKEPSFTWLQNGFAAYHPDTAVISYLKKYLPKYNMIVFIGTWCDDSQDMLPKLYKVLKLTNYPMSQYFMYGVDKAKRAKYVEHKLYNITNVPTIIVTKNNTEIGRITETVNKSVEGDLKAIVKRDVLQSEANEARQ